MCSFESNKFEEHFTYPMNSLWNVHLVEVQGNPRSYVHLSKRRRTHRVPTRNSCWNHFASLEAEQQLRRLDCIDTLDLRVSSVNTERVCSVSNQKELRRVELVNVKVNRSI